MIYKCLPNNTNLFLDPDFQLSWSFHVLFFPFISFHCPSISNSNQYFLGLVWILQVLGPAREQGWVIIQRWTLLLTESAKNQRAHLSLWEGCSSRKSSKSFAFQQLGPAWCAGWSIELQGSPSRAELSCWWKQWQVWSTCSDSFVKLNKPIKHILTFMLVLQCTRTVAKVLFLGRLISDPSERGVTTKISWASSCRAAFQAPGMWLLAIAQTVIT